MRCIQPFPLGLEHPGREQIERDRQLAIPERAKLIGAFREDQIWTKYSNECEKLCPSIEWMHRRQTQNRWIDEITAPAGVADFYPVSSQTESIGIRAQGDPRNRIRPSRKFPMKNYQYSHAVIISR